MSTLLSSLSVHKDVISGTHRETQNFVMNDDTFPCTSNHTTEPFFKCDDNTISELLTDKDWAIDVCNSMETNSDVYNYIKSKSWGNFQGNISVNTNPISITSHISKIATPLALETMPVQMETLTDMDTLPNQDDTDSNTIALCTSSIETETKTAKVDEEKVPIASDTESTTDSIDISFSVNEGTLTDDFDSINNVIFEQIKCIQCLCIHEGFCDSSIACDNVDISTVKIEQLHCVDLVMLNNEDIINLLDMPDILANKIHITNNQRIDDINKTIKTTALELKKQRYNQALELIQQQNNQSNDHASHLKTIIQSTPLQVRPDCSSNITRHIVSAPELTLERNIPKQCSSSNDPEFPVSEEFLTALEKKSLICLLCVKTFKRRDKFHAHMRTHNGKKPYPCKVCAKSFTRCDQLTDHMKVHTGEKAFMCELCSKEFAHSSTLTRHMRTHTGEKPFKCKVCTTGFARSDQLHCHMRTHTGPRPFQCSVCTEAFAHSHHLKSHIRKHFKHFSLSSLTQN